MNNTLSLVGLALGLWLGLSLADFDQVLFFLRHRSIVTHSIIIPLLAYLFVPRSHSWVRMGLVGVCVGMAVHLSFDFFPNAWQGFALINLPLYGSLDQTLSTVWIGSNIVACFYLSLLLFKEGWEVIAAAIGMSIAFLLYAPGESVFWSALFLLAAALLVALILPESSASAVQRARSRLKFEKGVTV
ncbi:MAG: hypothetical protein HC893_06395 [Chloroflexaceae bacterium]|nr:hypothetical protein [Chloroflexaceae bacterium]